MDASAIARTLVSILVVDPADQAWMLPVQIAELMISDYQIVFESMPAYKDGEFIAYGTPWCGKEHYNTNTSAPLKGIVLVSRGEENSIEEIPSDKFNLFLVKQLYLPKDPSLRMKVLELGDKLFTTVKLYHLKCNISTDAAILARDKIHK